MSETGREPVCTDGFFPEAAQARLRPVSGRCSSRPGGRLAASAQVIEVDDITAGIVVLDQGCLRFFASEQACFPLDGALFRTIEQATRAARRILAGKDTTLRHRLSRRTVSADRTLSVFTRAQHAHAHLRPKP
jgi:hypothetical protein